MSSKSMTFQEVMQLSMVPSFEPILDLFPFGMPSAVRLVTDPDMSTNRLDGSFWNRSSCVPK